MPVLVVLLGTSVLAQVFAPGPGCWLGSISAYYYTSARAVFVACLCALGACLVIYHGNTPREDLTLNVSGMLGFVVAFVPAPLSGLSVAPESACRRSNVPSSDQIRAALDNNVLALLVAATFVLVIAYVFQAAAGSAGGLSWSLLVMCGVVAGVWALYLWDRSVIRAHGHLVAAVTMFAGFVLVVLLNSVRHPTLDPYAVAAPTPYRAMYRAILAAMVAAIVVLGLVALLGSFEHVVFWLEAVEIMLFATFWLVQSKELWNQAARE